MGKKTGALRFFTKSLTTNFSDTQTNGSKGVAGLLLFLISLCWRVPATILQALYGATKVTVKWYRRS